MKNVFFGIAGDVNGNGYDNGTNPSCALNSQNQVVEVHTTQGAGNGLWYWFGTVDGSEITWRSHTTIKGDGGNNPSVGMNSSGVVVEAHDSGHNTLWYWIGQVEDNDVQWAGHAGIGENGTADTGSDPAIAINDHGVVVEVHNSGHNTLWYWLGQADGNSIAWTGHGPVNSPGNSAADSGTTPSVAINNDGTVLEVHDSGTGTLWCWLGQVQGNAITWLSHGPYDSGNRPSVALGDDGTVIEVHETQGLGSGLWQRIGQVSGTALTWSDPFVPGQTSYEYDFGISPSVAFNGVTAVQVHQSQGGSGLYGTASLWFDRANWMQQNLSALGDRPLMQLAMPASHDSGMYLGGVSSSTLGKTQDFNIYSQLCAGVRYFDLRPKYDNGRFYIAHGVITGPALSDVLSQISNFFQNHSHNELVILKFSHYDWSFDQGIFDSLCSTIYGALSSWMYAGAAPTNGRLADTTLRTFLASNQPILVVCDACVSRSPAQGIYALPANVQGIIRAYRDWYAVDPENGDLTVFDVYSDTTDLSSMISGTSPDPDPQVSFLPQGQFPKFQGFSGPCYRNGAVRCDLFLLSWTLTPVTGVWEHAPQADRCLGSVIAPYGPNPAGRIMNLLYVDYVEYARPADIALIRNGCAPNRT